MPEARSRPAEDSPDANSARRRLRQKTGPQSEQAAGLVFETLGGKDGENETFSYQEALRKSSPELVGFASGVARGSHKYDLDDHAWLSSHWKSSSQRRKADMGDPMAVAADMVNVIAANAESVLAIQTTAGSDGQTLHAQQDD